MTVQKFINIFNSVLGIGLATIVILASTPAHSARTASPISTAVPCAILLDFEGEVQILDATRSHVQESHKQAGVGCGSWVSVQRGWANLLHRQGFQLRSGPDSFFQIYDHVDEQGQKIMTGKDHVIIYKGKVHAVAPHGSGELRLQTANARARLNGSVALMIYERKDEASQLIGLEGQSSLENRFQQERQIVVRSGEATTLDVSNLRILPSTPKAVQQASLKLALHNIKIEEGDWRRSLQAAQNRSNRKFASLWSGKAPDAAVVMDNVSDVNRSLAANKNQDSSGRSPASQKQLPKQTLSEIKMQKRKGQFGQDFHYDRFPASSADARVESYLDRRLVGDAKVNPKQFLQPHAFAQEQQRQEAAAESDPGAKFDGQKVRDYEKEKTRLIQELQSIRLNP